MGLTITKNQTEKASVSLSKKTEKSTSRKKSGSHSHASDSPKKQTISLFEQSVESEGNDASRKLVGVLSDIRHYKEDSHWGIFWVTDETNTKRVVKGVLENPRIGMDVLAFGQFVNDAKFGPQFDATVIVESLPEPEAWNDREKVAKSLSSLPHMTNARFDKLWEKYGPEIRTHMTIPKDVHKAVMRKDFTLAQAHEMVQAFLDRGRFERLHMFIAEMGGGHGIVKKIINHHDEKHGQGKWDVDACVSKYRGNPYDLVKIKGMGFLTVDAMALKMKGYHETHEHRLRGALLYVLSEMVTRDGHTAIPAQNWAEETIGKMVLRMDNASDEKKKKVTEALNKYAQALMEENKVAVYKHTNRIGNETLFVADFWMFQSEKNVALHLYQRLQRNGSVIPASILESVSQKTILSDLQKKAILTALSKRVGVLTGGPGTGKTTCVKTIIEAASAAERRVALCAPTGKAASRLTEVAKYPATTIHSLIKKAPGGKSEYKEDNPYPADLFIVDESSMVDTDLMSDLISAMPSSAGLLLVGDVHQLPSVGPGQVLSDIVASGWFPVGRLIENFRQATEPLAGAIPEAASKVIEGQFQGVLSPWRVNVYPDNLKGYHAYAMDDGHGDAMEPEIVLQELLRLIRDALKRKVPAKDIQILSPMRKGVLGVNALNFHLQKLMNAENMRRTGICFHKPREGDPWIWHVGDRVVVTRNQNDLGVYNGDVGEVIAVYPKFSVLPEPARETLGVTSMNFRPFMMVRIAVPADGFAVESGSATWDSEKNKWYTDIQVDAEMAKDMEPSYAMTFHKTQGSEYPLVFMVLHTQHWIMCNRPLVYTGMTRAQKGLILLGASKAVRQAVKTLGNNRTTLLLKMMASENFVDNHKKLEHNPV